MPVIRLVRHEMSSYDHSYENHKSLKYTCIFGEKSEHLFRIILTYYERLTDVSNSTFQLSRIQGFRSNVRPVYGSLVI